MNRQDEQGICIRAHLTCKEKKKKKVMYYHFILDLGLLIYPKTTSHPPSALQFIHGLSPRPKEEASRISRYTLFLQCCLFICPVDFFIGILAPWCYVLCSKSCLLLRSLGLPAIICGMEFVSLLLRCVVRSRCTVIYTFCFVLFSSFFAWLDLVAL